MLKLYRYLYYSLYSWNLKTWGKRDRPEWNALFGVSAMIFFNIILICLIPDLFGIDMLFKYEISNKIIIAISLIILGLNYYIFLYRKKYELLKKEFSDESIKKRSRNILLLWVYVILTFILPVIIIYINRKYYK
jgi:hypothetical protein